MVLRLLTAAFWQAGNLPAAARTVRDWARVETDRPTPERFAARIYEDMGAIDLAAEAAARAANRAPDDASAWERLGRLRLRLMDRAGAITRARAGPAGRPDGRGPARPRARLPPGRRRRRRGVGGRGGDPDRSRVAARLVGLRPRAGPHRSRSASASRPAAGRSRSATDAEVADLLARVEAAQPRALSERTRGLASRSRRPAPRPGRLARRDRALAPAHRAGLLRAPSGARRSRGSPRPARARRAARRRGRRAAAPRRPRPRRPPRPGTRRGRPGLTGIRTPTWSHQSRPGPTASTIPCWGGGSSEPGGHEQAGAADPVGIELLDHDAVEQWAELAAHCTV